MHLRISFELPLKRSRAVGGLSVFMKLGGFSGNEGGAFVIITLNLLMEFHQAYTDSSCMMEPTETLIRTLATEVAGKLKLNIWTQPNRFGQAV